MFCHTKLIGLIGRQMNNTCWPLYLPVSVILVEGLFKIKWLDSYRDMNPVLDNLFFQIMLHASLNLCCKTTTNLRSCNWGLTVLITLLILRMRIDFRGWLLILDGWCFERVASILQIKLMCLLINSEVSLIWMRLSLGWWELILIEIGVERRALNEVLFTLELFFALVWLVWCAFHYGRGRMGCEV